MTNDVRAMFDRRFLGAWDLVGGDGKPRDFTVEITGVAAEKLRQPGTTKVERHPIVSIKGAEKKLKLNKTNANTIASMYGNDVRAWAGKRITLYPTKTKFGAETVDAIRVRPKVPEGKAEGVESREVDADMRAKQEAAREAVARGEDPNA